VGNRPIVSDEFRVPIDSDADTVIARQAGRDVALRIGFTRTDATFIATAISEIARNITVHAGAGEIVLRELEEDGRKGLAVIARDEGPGIGDVEAVKRQEFPAGAGLGMGIWGAMRLMDEVDIESLPGKGTTVTMKKWCGFDEVAAFLDHRA
jgi:anti-sigma regulatory factor (Ser/Thr protein kinase)